MRWYYTTCRQGNDDENGVYNIRVVIDTFREVNIYRDIIIVLFCSTLTREYEERRKTTCWFWEEMNGRDKKWEYE